MKQLMTGVSSAAAGKKNSGFGFLDSGEAALSSFLIPDMIRKER